MRPTKEGLLVGGIGDITSISCPLLEAEQDFFLRRPLAPNSFYTRHVTTTAPRRLGILGGTFDPPHAGHLAAAVAVQTQVGLDDVVLMVANEPWQMTSHTLQDAKYHNTRQPLSKGSKPRRQT